jgi:hypothetical protein
MTQSDLNRAVASRTGESVREISRRGFVPLTRVPLEQDSEPLDWLDWDAFDQLRIGILFPQRARPATAF